MVQSSDKSFMDKCHYQHMANAQYSRAKVTTMEFSIKHFAGSVSYDMTDFLEKNRDVLKPDVVHMFINSHSQVRLQEQLINSLKIWCSALDKH